MNWYALFVVTGMEEYVQKWLNLYFDASILRSIIPKRRLVEWRDGKEFSVMKKMFPGYVIINTVLDETTYKKIKSLPKLIRILNNGTYCSEIDEAEMSPILKLVGDGEIIDFSKAYMENAKIVISSGPLYGMEGKIVKVNRRKRRAKIILNFLNCEKVFDVGLEILDPKR